MVELDAIPCSRLHHRGRGRGVGHLTLLRKIMRGFVRKSFKYLGIVRCAVHHGAEIRGAGGHGGLGRALGRGGLRSESGVGKG